MRLAIRHVTHYRFESPILYGLQRMRLTPKTTQGQHIVNWSMEYRGAHEQLSYDDQNFNHVTLVAVDEGVREVAITCRGTVDTQDHAGVLGQHAGHLPLWAFLGVTRLTKPGPRVRQLVAGVERSDEGMVATLHNLSAVIRERVTYAKGETEVDTTAEEAVLAGRGVCQDHAHIFIAAARSLDIPARYVSGYLMMNDRVGQDATHAWVEAWVQGLGWVGFDPTNNIMAAERHVRAAVGRDYADVPPTRGTYKGRADSELSIAVSLEPTGAPVRHEDFLKVTRPMTSPTPTSSMPERLYHQQQQQQ